MNWESVGQFFSMGGRAWFVWGSYGVTVLAIAIEIGLLRARRRRAVEELQRAAAAINAEAARESTREAKLEAVRSV
jgi:heme exporter protein D